MNKGRKIVIIVISIMVIAGLVGGYVINFTLAKNQNSQTDKVGEITSDQADRETQKINDLNDKLLRIDSQGNVEVGVTLLNPIKDDDKYIVFKTQFNTHSVNLDGYDFGKMVTLKTSDGIELKKGIIWGNTEGEGHHLTGYYKVPKDINGKSVITQNTKYVELDISGLDNVNNRSFKWENDALKLIPNL